MNAISPGARLFEAKFRIPRAGKILVNRHRLCARLDDAAECKLVLVSAPAGYGKTTLISAWLREREGAAAQGAARKLTEKAAWLSLDDRDNNLAAFVGHLIGAIQYAVPGNRFDAVDLLQLPTTPTATDLAQVLIADLAHFDQNLIFVLDDYHLIHEAAVHALIELLIAYAPDQFRLIVIARHDPPLPTARLALQGKARIFRANDLRFRQEEAEEFLAQAAPGSMTPETRAAVTEQAAGWIAQLRLAAILAQNEPDQLAHDAAHEVAMDYLVQELLASEAPQVRGFLLATSVLERFCPSLVAALLTPPAANEPTCGMFVELGHHDSHELLSYVVQAGLFVTELDGAGTWYRYHDLFREMLFQRLRSAHPDDVPILRRRAFEWLKRAGCVEEALAQAEALGDLEAAADLIETQVMAALNLFHWQTVQRWLELLPLEKIRVRPALLVAHGYVAANLGSIERLEKVLAWAMQAFDESRLAPGQAAQLLGSLELLRSEYALATNQLELSLKTAQSALARLPRELSFERAFATIRLSSGLAAFGKYEEAQAVLAAELRSMAVESSPITTRMRITVAFNYGRVADYRNARRELELLEQVESGAYPYNDCWIHWSLGRVDYEWNELDSAVKHFRQASHHGGNYMRGCESYMGLALALEALGDRPGADHAAEQALEFAKSAGARDLVTLALSFGARLRLMRGEADQTLAALAPSIRQDPFVFYLPIELPRLTEARRLLRNGRPAALQQAHGILEDAARFLADTHQTLYLIPTLCLLARLHGARNQKVRALATLAQAVELGTPGGLIRTFLDAGPDLVGLLYELRLPGAAGEHVATILAEAAKEPTFRTPDKAVDSLIEPLTSRELTILELLTDRLADKEIAAALSISPLTVRKHTGNIFAKLQVRNRREAAARAVELGLVREKR